MYLPWCTRWCKCSHISFDVSKHRHLVQQLTKASDWFCLHPWFRRDTGPTSLTKRLQLCIILHDAVISGAKYGLWLWQVRLVPLPHVIIIPGDSQTRRYLVCLHRKMRVGNLCVPTAECRVCTCCLFINLYLVCTDTCSGFIQVFDNFLSEVCVLTYNSSGLERKLRRTKLYVRLHICNMWQATFAR